MSYESGHLVKDCDRDTKKKFNFKHDEPDPVEKSFMNNFFIFNNDFIVWEGIRMKIEVLCNFRLDPVSVPRTLVAVSPSSSVRVRAGGGGGSGSVEPAGTLTLSLSTQQTKPNPNGSLYVNNGEMCG